MRPPHDIVFKYTHQETARIIIANCTLRIGRPTEMNDPFDAYSDDLFDVELKDMYDRAARRRSPCSTTRVSFFSRTSRGPVSSDADRPEAEKLGASRLQPKRNRRLVQ